MGTQEEPVEISLSSGVHKKLDSGGRSIIFSGGIGEIKTLLSNVGNPATNEDDKKYATVLDHVNGINIIPFRNCRYSNVPDNETIIKEKYTECDEYGTCYGLMKLVGEWENVIDGPLYEYEGKKANGVNMLSQLACVRGGIIHPVDSGQGMGEGLGKSDYDITYNLNEDEALFVAVVAAESIGEGQLAWQVVSNVIMNRVGQREWSKLTTPTEVMKQKYQFSCLNDGGSPQYLKAVNYLKNRLDDGNTYEQIVSVVMPIYHQEVSDITGGAQLYYSPKSMVPPGSAPSWASEYKQITVPGIKSDDFMLYTGEKIQ